MHCICSADTVKISYEAIVSRKKQNGGTVPDAFPIVRKALIINKKIIFVCLLLRIC